jgi:hypothetical protein
MVVSFDHEPGAKLEVFVQGRDFTVQGRRGDTGQSADMHCLSVAACD